MNNTIVNSNAFNKNKLEQTITHIQQLLDNETNSGILLADLSQLCTNLPRLENNLYITHTLY